MRKIKDLSGQKFERLTAFSVHSKNPSGQTLWLCRCDCGNTVIAVGANLTRGHTRSCGCFARERTSESVRTHGMTGLPAYISWEAMWTRCRNEKRKQSKDYVGRGISVCKRWESFENFLEDMGERPEGMTLDRIKNDLGYSKSNCRWATQRQQCRNTRRNRLIEFEGESRCIAEWSEIKGIPQDTISYRLKTDWPMEHIFAPVGISRKSLILQR